MGKRGGSQRGKGKTRTVLSPPKPRIKHVLNNKGIIKSDRYCPVME